MCPLVLSATLGTYRRVLEQHSKPFPMSPRWCSSSKGQWGNVCRLEKDRGAGPGPWSEWRGQAGLMPKVGAGPLQPPWLTRATWEHLPSAGCCV